MTSILVAWFAWTLYKIHKNVHNVNKSFVRSVLFRTKIYVPILVIREMFWSSKSLIETSRTSWKKLNLNVVMMISASFKAYTITLLFIYRNVIWSINFVLYIVGKAFQSQIFKITKIIYVRIYKFNVKIAMSLTNQTASISDITACKF